MEENSINFSMQDIMRLAATPAGQELLNYLQKKNQKQLQMAIAHAVSGNMDQAKALLSQGLGHGHDLLHHGGIS